MAEKTTESEDAVSVEVSPGDETPTPAKKRRRGSRGGKGRNAAARAAKAAKAGESDGERAATDTVDAADATDGAGVGETVAVSSKAKSADIDPSAEKAEPKVRKLRTARSRKPKVVEPITSEPRAVEDSAGVDDAGVTKVTRTRATKSKSSELEPSEEPKKPRRNTRRSVKVSDEQPSAAETEKPGVAVAKNAVDPSDASKEDDRPESKPTARPAVKPEVLAPFSPKMPPPAPRPVTAVDDEEGAVSEDEKPTRSRRGRSKSSGRLRKLAVEEAPAKQVSTEAASASEVERDGEESGPKKRSRRRGGRRRSGARRSEVEARAESADHSDEPAPTNRAKGRSRNGRAVGRYFMCVQRRDNATQIAVLEGRSLIEHYVSRPNDDVSQIDGNIYRSIVQNVLPGMEAAFVDIGTPKNAVLYRSDVRFDAEDLADDRKTSSKKRIEEMIKANEVLVAQVTKNPIGLKGARLNQEISLPGRFVVLMPNNSTYGISKRLPDNERKRLRRILDEVKPEEHGIILRTAAEGANADELKRDVERLVKTWKDIETKAKKGKGPQLLYREPEMAVRIIREEFNQNYRSVLIDDRELFEEVHEYVSHISPELADRIEYYDRELEPLSLFERHHVAEQLTKALDRKVWLPSGGSLIIERTEALTVIDVNTGKNVGKSSLEETVFRNNLEAADEIARQLRLRDIGGIIVIDFIDMEIKGNRDAVLERLREALARDKTRTQAFPIGELGLVEMTRKRISEGLVESFSSTCETCTGRGFVVDESLLEDH